jgi:Fur family ferric uptake transcriptional regulator
LIQEIFENTHEFFYAEDIYNFAKKKDPTIGIATIYRFLKELKTKNKVFCYSCNRRTLYSKERNSHCHYICEKTGKVTHFNIDNLDFLKKIKDKIPGSIKSIQLEIKGICDDCN